VLTKKKSDGCPRTPTNVESTPLFFLCVRVLAEGIH